MSIVHFLTPITSSANRKTSAESLLNVAVLNRVSDFPSDNVKLRATRTGGLIPKHERFFINLFHVEAKTGDESRYGSYQKYHAKKLRHLS